MFRLLKFIDPLLAYTETGFGSAARSVLPCWMIRLNGYNSVKTWRSNTWLKADSWLHCGVVWTPLQCINSVGLELPFCKQCNARDVAKPQVTSLTWASLSRKYTPLNWLEMIASSMILVVGRYGNHSTGWTVERYILNLEKISIEWLHDGVF